MKIESSTKHVKTSICSELVKAVDKILATTSGKTHKHQKLYNAHNPAYRRTF